MTALIAARTIQGIGAAMMMAMAMAMVGSVVAGAKTGRAMGLLGTMSAVGTALGPSLGGVLIALSGWQALFLVCVPVGLLSALLAHRTLPSDRVEMERKHLGFNYLGTAMLAVTLAAYTLAMTIGNGSFGTLNALLLALAIAGMGLFIVSQTRSATPLLPVNLFGNRTLSTGFVANVCVTAVVMATLVIGPFYLVGGLALDSARVGLVMTVGPVVAAVMGVPAGRLVDRNGAFRISLVGLVGMVVGCFTLAMISTNQGVLGYLLPLIVTTAGFAIFQAANNTSVMVQARSDQRGVVAGMLSLSRNLGLITGASFMGALFTFGSRSTSGTIASTGAIEAGMHLAFGVAAALMITTLVIVVWGQRLVSGSRPPHDRTPE
jgi:MFS family permease